VKDGKVTIFGDIANAFNTLSQAKTAESLRKKLPEAYIFHRLFSDITKEAVSIRGTRVTNLNFKIREGSLQGLNFTSESFELCFTEIIEWAQDEFHRMEGKTSSSYDIHLTRHFPSHLDVHTDDFGLPYSHTT